MAILLYRNIDIDASGFVPIVMPVDCDYVSLFNPPGGWFGFGAQSVTLRSDPLDAQTDKPLPAGNQELVTSPPRLLSSCRFRQGEVLVWAKADSGTVSLVLTCVG